MKKLRVALGALIAPASAPLLYFLVVTLGSRYPGANSAHPAKLVDELLFALLPMSYLVSLAVGVPAMLVLQRLHKLDLWRCVGVAAAIGALLGFAATYIFAGPPGSIETTANRLAFAMLSLVALTVIALAFGLIAGVPIRWEEGKHSSAI